MLEDGHNPVRLKVKEVIMKKYEVMRTAGKGYDEFCEGSFDTLAEANNKAKFFAEHIIALGRESKINYTYAVYVAETITDDDGEWVSTESAVGGYCKAVIGIL